MAMVSCSFLLVLKTYRIWPITGWSSLSWSLRVIFSTQSLDACGPSCTSRMIWMAPSLTKCTRLSGFSDRP